MFHKPKTSYIFEREGVFVILKKGRVRSLLKLQNQRGVGIIAAGSAFPIEFAA
jgi:hypothetical protein